jgi:cation transport ATPase
LESTSVQVVWEETFQGSSEQLMMVAGSLEHLSTHPIAACIVASAANAGVQLDLDVDAFENVPGMPLALFLD